MLGMLRPQQRGWVCGMSEEKNRGGSWGMQQGGQMGWGFDVHFGFYSDTGETIEGASRGMT